MSKSETPNQFKTTPEMEEMSLYYKDTPIHSACYKITEMGEVRLYCEDTSRHDFYGKTPKGKFKEKKIYQNKGKSYIRHKNDNYSYLNLSFHIKTNKPLKKGILKTCTPRKRKTELSLFDRLMNWLRGKK